MIDLATLLQSGESETLEFKERWNDAALETVAAFANTRGGTLVVGVADDGEVVGWESTERQLQTVVNQVEATLRLQPSVAVQTHKERKVLVVQTASAPTPAACRGHYFRRVGNTTRQIPPEELGRFFVARLGVKWDGLTGDYSLDELNEQSVRQFARIARRRLPYLREDEPIASVLEKLNLFQGGKLTRGAILLFGKDPQQHFLMAQVHMGRFKDAITILDDKLVKGNLFQQLEQAMALFQQYLQVRYEISGSAQGQDTLSTLQRREVWDYPLEALREALVNALVHRDYFEPSADIQIRVYDDRVVIANPGSLPEQLTVEELRREGHRSILRNPLLAQALYYSELVERWGTGTTRMIEACRRQGLPEPEFYADGGLFQVTFASAPYTEERLRKLDLSERQVKAVLWTREKGRITNGEYQELGGVSRRTATRELSDLVSRGILEQVGRTGKGTVYVLKPITYAPNAP